MNNRRRSILIKNRRDSSRGLAVKIHVKDIVEAELKELACNQQRYEDLDILRIKEDQLTYTQTDFNDKIKSQTTMVRRLMTPSRKKKFIDGMILKKLNVHDPAESLKLFSSINASTFIHNYDDKCKMKQVVIPEVKKKKYLELESKRKPIIDYSFKSLENWKLRMQERRNLKTSLSKRLQTDPDSLLISQSVQTKLFTKNQDDILEKIFPFFQSGTGAPIIRSSFPEREVTKQQLHLHRKNWEPKTPLQINMVGYTNESMAEIGESINDKRSSNVFESKKKILADDRYQKIMKEFSYNIPDVSGLIVRTQRYSTEIEAKENSTFLNLASENTLDKSESFFSPQLLINDELLLGWEKVNEEIEAPESTNYFHIGFSATILDVPQIRNIYFANRGACSITYSWKKLEPIRYLKATDIHPVFFFKINDGIILPDSNSFISITFNSKRPGFFDEMWEFTTKPKLSTHKVIFHFHAISLTPDFLIFERDKIETIMYESSKYQIAKEIVDDIVKYVLSREPVSSDKKKMYFNFDEEETFKRLNTNVLWNYEKVQQLKEFNVRITEKEWDLSLTSIEKMLHQYCDPDTESPEPSLEEFYSICNEINLPEITCISKENDLFNSPNNVQLICFSKLMNSIDEAENYMNLIGSQLCIYNKLPDDKSIPSISLPPKEESTKIERKGSGKKSTGRKSPEIIQIIERRKSSPSDEEMENQKIKFRNKAQHAVWNVMKKLLDELDVIFEKVK